MILLQRLHCFSSVHPILLKASMHEVCRKLSWCSTMTRCRIRENAQQRDQLNICYIMTSLWPCRNSETQRGAVAILPPVLRCKKQTQNATEAEETIEEDAESNGGDDCDKGTRGIRRQLHDPRKFCCRIWHRQSWESDWYWVRQSPNQPGSRSIATSAETKTTNTPTHSLTPLRYWYGVMILRGTTTITLMKVTLKSSCLFWTLVLRTMKPMKVWLELRYRAHVAARPHWTQCSWMKQIPTETRLYGSGRLLKSLVRLRGWSTWDI